MNIFYLSTNTDECARYHCDKHVVKMILETAQMLSTAHRVLDGDELADEKKLYKKFTLIILAQNGLEKAMLITYGLMIYCTLYVKNIPSVITNTIKYNVVGY